MTFSKPRKLSEGDSVDGFHCGVDHVDGWLRFRAKSAQSNGTAVVCVTFDEEQRLAGFYTLSAQSVLRDSVRGWLRRNSPEQIPVILLGMLGVDERYRGNGLGKKLLADAIRRSIAVAGEIGAKALLVEPLDESLEHFYETAGFLCIPDTKYMFVKLPQVLRKAHP